MQDLIEEPPEFTDDQLRQVLKEVGEKARREAFAAGLPVAIFKEGKVVLQFADGREEVVHSTEPESRKNGTP